MSNDVPVKRKRFILFLQIFFFVFIYAVIIIFLRNKMPDISRMIGMAEQIYGTYGYLLIFLAALAEGTFIIGLYMPGSFIVLLGVSLARLGVTSFPLVILFGTLGFCSGYSINYCLGRFGWYRIIEGIGFEKKITETKYNLKHHYNKALFWGYIMPSTGSMLSTACGILKVPFKEFISKTMMIQAFWSMLLGGLAYIFGMTFIHMFLVYFGSIALLGFGMYFLKRKYRK
ncbi:VTT domain-containing protein [Patescibacteria group bacterium]|nr:VTT domain-containing protein [Patescibacteria group bacterium]